MPYVSLTLAADRLRQILEGSTTPFDVDLVVELMIRMAQSCLLTPAIALHLSDDENVRTFARGWLRPMLARSTQ
jgi:hypothetical protein